MPGRLLALGKTLHDGHYQLGTDSVPDLIKNGSELVGSTLSIVNSANMIVVCSTFRRCKIVAETCCSEVSWPGCVFEDCSFSGHFYGCDFVLSSRSCPGEGGLRDCDFSSATLHLCGFLNCALESLILPRWPHFTVVHPAANRDDASATFTGDLRFIYDLVSVNDASVVALTFHWPTILAKRTMTISTEAVKTLLESKPYILL